VTHVAELVLGVGEPGAETSARALRGVEVPVAYARRRCLIDHLERMQEVLEEAGYGAARIDVGDEALLAVETTPGGHRGASGARRRRPRRCRSAERKPRASSASPWS
jgi:hypothetical protein